MKDLYIKILNIAKMEILAPISGGGVGIFTWIIKLAPYISVSAAVIGIVLGILSYRLKRKVANMEMEYLSAKIKSLNK